MATAAPKRTRKVSTNGTAPEVKVAAPFQIQRIDFGELDVPIEGITALIQNRFSEKARKQMLDKQMGATRQKKPPKDPEADFNAAKHRLEDGWQKDRNLKKSLGYGHPATAFKAATVEAARFFEGVTMEDLKRCIFIDGIGIDQLVPLSLDAEPEMREDMVRNETGVADIRFRPYFMPWRATLHVRFNMLKLSGDSVVNLVDAGGQSSGIGEWRPGSKKARNGSFGQYRVAL